MLKKIVFILIFLSGLFLDSASAQTLNISELHKNDTWGVPLLLDQIVTVSGEVTVTDQFASAAYIQDYTGGVGIYDNDFVSGLSIGDYVTISGQVTQYYGLTEIKEVNVIEQLHREPTVQPLVVTCSEIQVEGNNGVENFEGELIRINNVNVNTATIVGIQYNMNLFNISGSGIILLYEESHFFFSSTISLLFSFHASDNLT